MSNTQQQRVYAGLGAAVAWFALILQFVLLMQNRKTSAGEAIVRYFSYFTVLSNILVALCYTFFVAGIKGFFAKAGTQTAIVVYIVIVGLVYNTVLRFQWLPSGLARISDELFHSVTPVLFVLYWLLYVDKRSLQWRDIPAWLLFPLAYLGYTLLHGSLTAFYPYPFLDVGQLGYPSALLNCLWVTIAFILFSLLFVGLAKAWRKRPPVAV